jgi:hypothetical protein
MKGANKIQRTVCKAVSREGRNSVFDFTLAAGKAAMESGRKTTGRGTGSKRDEMHNHVIRVHNKQCLQQPKDSRWFLEKLLWRKQSYLLTAFFDQAADPMKHSCLGLLLANRRVKLIVKGNVGWGSGNCQS